MTKSAILYIFNHTSLNGNAASFRWSHLLLRFRTEETVQTEAVTVRRPVSEQQPEAVRSELRFTPEIDSIHTG